MNTLEKHNNKKGLIQNQSRVGSLGGAVRGLGGRESRGGGRGEEGGPDTDWVPAMYQQAQCKPPFACQLLNTFHFKGRTTVNGAKYCLLRVTGKNQAQRG